MTEQQAQELIEKLDRLIAAMERVSIVSVPYVYPIPLPTYPQPYYPNTPTYPSYPITICTTDSTKDYTLIS